MGGNYPPLNRRQVEKILKALGFIPKPQRSGTTHTQWEGYTGGKRRIVTVDDLGTNKTYGRSLLASMIRQSGVSKEQFYTHL